MCWTVPDHRSLSTGGTIHCGCLQLRVHESEKDRQEYEVRLNERLGKECGGVGENQRSAWFLGWRLSVLAAAPSELASLGELREE